MTVTQNRPKIPSEQTYVPSKMTSARQNQPWVNTNITRLA